MAPVLLRHCAVLLFLLPLPALPVLAVAPDLLLAQTDRGEVDVSRYLVSEKLDGVRAYWDGRQLSSRGGHPIAAPSWFIAPLPPRTLDGELWMGRGRFEEVSGLARREVSDDALWKQVSYLLFELPGAEGGFAQRARRLEEIAAQAGVPWVRAVEQFRVADRKALRQRLNAVNRAGGEGLMLHLADAPYVTGRSEVLLKVKAWHDAEARVVAHVPGRGRYAGMLGALRVRTPEGREFKLGTGFTDAQRRLPPAVGTTVTYRYRNLTENGLPRHASFWRVREAF